jgi:hypothetical protein
MMVCVMQLACNQLQYWLSYRRCVECDFWRTNFTNKLTRRTLITKLFCQCGQERVNTIINFSLSANPRILSTVCFKWSVYFYRFVLNKLANLTPKTSNTWRKLRLSAFQQYKGLGVSDRVFLSKSLIACTPQHINPIVLSDWLSTV